MKKRRKGKRGEEDSYVILTRRKTRRRPRRHKGIPREWEFLSVDLAAFKPSSVLFLSRVLRAIGKGYDGSITGVSGGVVVGSHFNQGYTVKRGREGRAFLFLPFCLFAQWGARVYPSVFSVFLTARFTSKGFCSDGSDHISMFCRRGGGEYQMYPQHQ